VQRGGNPLILVDAFAAAQNQKCCASKFLRHRWRWTATTIPKDGAPFVSSSKKKFPRRRSIVKLNLPLEFILVYGNAGELSAEKEVILASFPMKALMVREDTTREARYKQGRGERSASLWVFFDRAFALADC